MGFASGWLIPVKVDLSVMENKMVFYIPWIHECRSKYFDQSLIKVLFTVDTVIENFDSVNCPLIKNWSLLQGKLWLNSTVSCLLRRLHQVYSQDTINCRDVMLDMMDAVSDCPMNNDYVSVCNVYENIQNRNALEHLYVHVAGSFYDQLR